MRMIRNIKSALIIGCIFLISSCNSWLEIDPDDRIMEDALFRDRAGFLTALNGVYSELNSSSIYGQNLSMGMIDVMAQYYNCMVENHSFVNYMTYSYGSAQYKNRFDNIWTKMYAQIANCNAILEHCGEGNEVLPDDYYKLIKGEALALRAMMHLDLLRMFGPIWSETTKSDVCIPYMTSADRVVQPLLSADSVAQHVVKDLMAASDLLIDVDPVITEKSKYYANLNSGNDFNYRQYRMNYYAVQALLARVYLWTGNKTKAGEYARNVIRDANPDEDAVFPLVTPEYMETYVDRIFSTEVLFGLYNTSRSDGVFKSMFASELSMTSLLTMAGDLTSGRVNAFYDDKNDYRYKMWEQTVKNNNSVVYFTKYKDETEANKAAEYEMFRYMIPLIRMSEMYLIAAECADDPAVAMQYFNKVRFHRNCVNQSASSMEEVKGLLKAEYMREFIGEGQMFFYYKRNGIQNIPDGSTTDKMQNIDLASYVFPLPDSETSQRAE